MSGMFKPLQAEDIECRVAQVNKDNSVNLLLYKTARTDANVLDEVIGQFNWQCEFREVNGVVYCGIGIKEPTTKEWVWKWDAGSSGNFEEEKSTASDAFKRAGFKWGIGRELYYSPRIRVKADVAGVKDGKCFTPFKVSKVEYTEDGHFRTLIISHAWTDDILFQWHSSEPKKGNPDAWDAPTKPTPEITTKASAYQVRKILEFYKGKDDKLQALMAYYEVSDVRDLTVTQATEVITKKGIK